MFIDEEMADDGTSPSNNHSKNSSTNEEFFDNCQITTDNSDNILKILKKLWIDQNMCDIYLKVGDRQYGAHKLILSASSDVFQAMLMNSAWSEWKESHIQLQELPFCESVFPTFLEYLYTGKIHITHTNVMPILALADKYLVKSLSRTCIQYMCKHVPHAASHNQLSSWLQYSTICDHTLIFDTCQNYLKWNFETVANTSDFTNIACDTFIKILQQSDVVVHNEIMLYNCVVRWLELQKIKMQQAGSSDNKQFSELVEKVMKYIRFPMMTPRELADLLMSPMIRQHEEFFVDRMVIGLRYHSGYMHLIEQYYNTEPELFQARLYTSDSCSASLSIENFWNRQSYHFSAFLFSSHLSAAEHEANQIAQWEVGLYPKGVHFRKCLLILSQGTMEVPEKILRMVRLSLTCRETPISSIRVKVSVLIYGIHGGVEHVMDVKERIHRFTPNDKRLNIDDLIPFDQLNPSATSPIPETPYLIGPDRDLLKLNIVISPVK